MVVWLGLSGGAHAGEESDLLEIDRSNFDRSSVIDNEWWPLKPGTQLIYEGYTVEDEERIPHRIVFTVTDLTKVINGVRTRVIWDRDWRSLLSSHRTTTATFGIWANIAFGIA